MNSIVPPIFLFGFERSGTTLLAMMVGAHSQIAVPLSTTGLWFRYADRLEKYRQLKAPEDVTYMVDDILSEERIQMWDVQIDRDDVLKDLHCGNYPGVIDRFHTLYAHAKGKPYWANSDIATLDRMDDINRWFPQALFIHIVRDGRDVALSHETMPYGAANTLDCAQHWVNRLTLNQKMGSMLETRRYMIVRYEDLILNTEGTLRQLCDFIGVPFSSRMIKYMDMVDGKIPQGKRWLWPALNKPPVKSKAYGWRTRMNPSKRILFERYANEMLRKHGYEAYDVIPKSVSSYVRELWCFFGQGGRFRRIAASLGLKRESHLERQWKKNENK